MVPRRRLRALGLVVGSIVGSLAPAAPQGLAEKHPEHGLSLSRPRDYDPLPVRPSERFRVLAYRERTTDAIERATLGVYVVPHDAPAGETVTDVEAFLARELAGLELEEVRAGRSRYGYRPRRWVGDAGDRAVFVHAWIGADRTVVLEGRCDVHARGVEERVWESVLGSMRLHAPAELAAERARIERIYASGRWSGAAHRTEVRLRMVDGWKARDTTHFLVVYHDVEESLVRELCTNVEAMRRAFQKLCPPDRGLDTVSTLRICRDREEYLAYGGPGGTFGYFSAGEQELVLFDARELAAAHGGGDDLTQAVLFHEAFHQYLHDAVGRAAPDPWFDEGVAEYFAATELRGGRVGETQVNAWRLPTIQAALAQGRAWPWAQAVELPQQAFYADAQLLYAQAWSLVYFLRESDAASANTRWRRILPTYFKTLRSAWARERLRGASSVQEWGVALERARREARAAAFGDVDWEELEKAWAEFVLGLELLPEGR